MNFTDRQLRNFWRRVTRTTPDGCWNWAGKSRSQDGYGIATVGSISTTAHRIAYILSTGEVPPSNMHVMHSCDNRLCCNPTHLSVGTPLQNAADCVEKGRRLRCGQKRFELGDICRAWFMYHDDKIDCQTIAKRFRVRTSTVVSLLVVRRNAAA